MSTAQDDFKKKLVENFKNNYTNGLWCRIVAHNDSNNDDIVRLMAVNNDYFSFTSCGKHHQTLLNTVYLCHRDDFFVHWVETGPNMATPPFTMTGEELEDDLYAENGREFADETSSE
jgi:hypothetical protein